jgi:hypothetical protein
MRKIIRLVMLSVILIVAIPFHGCGITSSGEVLTVKKDFANFTDIDVSSSFDFEVTRADTYSVVIEVDESLADYVEVSQLGQTLKIFLKPHHIFTDFTLGVKTLKAEITVPALYGLQISGASKGTITGFKGLGNFEAVVSGASSLEMIDLEANSINLEVSGASKVKGNATAGNARFDVSGASHVELSGSTTAITLWVSGASKADLTDFLLNNADVELSGASEATVNVKEQLDIVVSGASRLYFLGNPTMGNVEVTGASTVKHK